MYIKDPIRVLKTHLTLLALPKFTVFEIRISSANSAGRVSGVCVCVQESARAWVSFVVNLVVHTYF